MTKFESRASSTQQMWQTYHQIQFRSDSVFFLSISPCALWKWNISPFCWCFSLWLSSLCRKMQNLIDVMIRKYELRMNLCWLYLLPLNKKWNHVGKAHVKWIRKNEIKAIRSGTVHRWWQKYKNKELGELVSLRLCDTIEISSTIELFALLRFVSSTSQILFMRRASLQTLKTARTRFF